MISGRTEVNEVTYICLVIETKFKDNPLSAFLGSLCD